MKRRQRSHTREREGAHGRARYFGWVGSLLFVMCLVAACAFDSVDLAGRDCPCIAEFVCDTSTNRCVHPDELHLNNNNNNSSDGATDGGSVLPDGAPACTGEGCACARDQDCLDPSFSKCAQNKCVACTQQPDNCPPGRYCLSTFQCAPGCKLDSECVGGDAGTSSLCNTSRHQCVECLAQADCPPGKLCSPSGKCVEGCDLAAGKTCVAGTCCSSLCVNVTNDLFNCNSCGQACAGGDTLCCASSCTNPLTSPLNCGACGNACSTVNGTPTCSAGSCSWTCNAGYGHCQVGANTGCETNTATDPTHCGSCTTVCSNIVKNATGIGCANSACTYGTCNLGFGNCDGNATNGCESATTGDVMHCGNCTINCNTQVLHATGITCSSSACNYAACASGYGDCDGIRSNGCECACGGSEQTCCPGGGCIPGKLCEAQTNLCK